MANTKKIRLPVTVKINGEYKRPGTEIELHADEADRMIELYGQYDDRGLNLGPGIDPGNTNMRNVDAASIHMLNEQGKLENAHSPLSGGAPGSASSKSDGAIKTPETITDEELSDLKKDELVAFANANEIIFDKDALKPDLLETIKAEVAKRRAAADK